MGRGNGTERKGIQMDMMEESQAKNRAALEKILGKFIPGYKIEFPSPEETFKNAELIAIAKGKLDKARERD